MTEPDSSSYVELPDGLFTSDGIWYHTTIDDLHAFASETIDRVGLESLLGSAATWGRLPTTMGLISLVLFLTLAAPWQSVLGSLSVYLMLAVLSPSVVIYSLIAVVRKLDHPIFQGLIYVLGLSFLASSASFPSVAIGLTGFVLYRWQVVSRVLSPVVDLLRNRWSPLDAPDQILRGVLIRASQKYSTSLTEVDRMEKRMIEIMNYHRRESKK